MEAQDVNSRHQDKKISSRDLIHAVREQALHVLRVLHTGYGVVIFTILFILILPLLLIPIVFKRQFRLIGIFNRWWARLLFILIGMPYKVEYHFTLDPDKQYIFCPNHFSYLDIPTMGLNRHDTIFVGKSSIGKVPVFGYMYNRLHITVDRSKLKSRYTSLLQAMEAIDEGKSLVIYPEGGILTKNPPQLGPFKEGAFRVAIEKQIPIVPVTIPYNWIILPDNEFLLRWRPVKVVFHKPIDTTGLTLNDTDFLKSTLYDTITGELKKYNTHED